MAAAASFPGCLKAMLPTDQLALIGFAQSEEVQTSNGKGDRIEQLQYGSGVSARLHFVTSRGRVLSFPDVVSPEVFSGILQVPVETFRTFHISWNEPIAGKPGYEVIFSFAAITTERHLAKHLVLKHGASLVLDSEENAVTAISEQERFVYPDEKEIEDAEWRGHLTDPVYILEVNEPGGVVYRTRDNVLYRDCKMNDAPSVFAHYPWQQRLLRWVRSLHPGAKTLNQSMAFASMESVLNVPSAMLDREDFEDNLKHFPLQAPDGAIPVDELFANTPMLRCVSLSRWRRSDPGRYPATEDMPDLRYFLIV